MASDQNASAGFHYPPPSFLDPAILMQIETLELRARTVVEGFFTGLHRSPYHGFSVEFTEYRQYSAGDDLRYLDWRLYARSDRYYIKQFEDETNLRCHLLIDNSQSMNYGSLPYTKAEYGKTLAGTLAYFLNTQRDAVGLFRFSNEIDEYLPARYRPGHLRSLLLSLEKQPEGSGTGLHHALERVSEIVRKRGLFVLITDFLCELDDLETRLGYLRAARKEVIVFQIIDPAERDFPFTDSTLFVDAETGRDVFVDPAISRKRYMERFQSHQTKVAAICERLGIQLLELTTDAPLEHALSEFLRTRMRLKPVRS
ncbi:DUF58 domain-containing protein [Planctomicrobium sp. SH527]|uniref:DUF58 domain-containing protein n=1 Tax=Planctomicrobium sp. SH527 TaxID=3448123 RepID=UPI003F5C5BF4